MKCYIYRNLHKPGHTYSLRAMEGEHKGLVIGYSPYFVVEGAKFVVNQAGRQRVLDSGHKNVHAGIVGNVTVAYDYTVVRKTSLESQQVRYHMPRCLCVVKYNPHKAATFYDVNTDEAVYGAKTAIVMGSRIEAYVPTVLADLHQVRV